MSASLPSHQEKALVADLFAQWENQKLWVESSGNSQVLEFPVSGFENYLLKIKNPTFKTVDDFLKSTSALCAVNYGLYRNYGQPILWNEDAEIVLRVPGISLSRILDTATQNEKNHGKNFRDASTLAKTQMLKKLSELPIESYMDFVEQARYAEAHGAGFDFRLGNILLDETTQKLHIIDVVDERNRIHHLCSEIMLIPFEEMAKFCPENSQAKTHFLRMKEKMEIAAREYSVPVTILEAIRKQH